VATQRNSEKAGDENRKSEAMTRILPGDPVA
jgi:hypothetical protein